MPHHFGRDSRRDRLVLRDWMPDFLDETVKASRCANQQDVGRLTCHVAQPVRYVSWQAHRLSSGYRESLASRLDLKCSLQDQAGLLLSGVAVRRRAGARRHHSIKDGYRAASRIAAESNVQRRTVKE